MPTQHAVRSIHEGRKARGSVLSSTVFGTLAVYVFFACGAPGILHAATVGIVETSATAGQANVSIPVSFLSNSGETIAALAFDLRFDAARIQWKSASLEPTLTAFGKQLQAFQIEPGHVRLVIYGTDRQTLASGQLAECLIQIATDAPAGQTAIQVEAATAAKPDGTEFSALSQDGRLWIDANSNPSSDTTPPVLRVGTPKEGTSYKSGGIVDVAGTVSDDTSGVIKLTVNQQPVTVKSDGSFSFGYKLTGVALGPYEVWVVATDEAGNIEDKKRVIQVEPGEPTDTTPPTLTLDSPQNQATVASGEVVSVKGTAKDDGTDAVTVKVNGVSVSVDAQGLFGYEFKDLPSGAHTIQVEASDAAGNKQNIVRTVQVQGDSTASRSLVKTAAEAASASSGWTLEGTERYSWTSNQWLEYRVDFGKGGMWTLGILGTNQRNTAAPNLPSGFNFLIAVAVDGSPKGTMGVLGAIGEYRNGFLPVSFPEGVHTVRFTWLNDAWVPGLYDANLRVKSVSFTAPGDPVPADPTSSTQNAQQNYTASQAWVTSSGWNLSGSERFAYAANQWLEYRVDFGKGGAWAVGLTAMNYRNSASPNLPNGFNFLIELAIDGASKGTLSVPGSASSFRTGTSTVTVPAGVHTVRFTWTNDTYVPGQSDANIRVQGVAFTPQ